MSRSNPAKALNGARTGHICDRCNKRVRTGDLVRAYAAHCDGDRWELRWECGETTIGEETDGADEAIVEAVFETIGLSRSKWWLPVFDGGRRGSSSEALHIVFLYEKVPQCLDSSPYRHSPQAQFVLEECLLKRRNFVELLDSVDNADVDEQGGIEVVDPSSLLGQSVAE